MTLRTRICRVLGRVPAYFVGLRKAYGLKFLLYLVVSQLFIKGILFRTTISLALPLFKSLGIDAVHLQLLGALALSPWTIKPVIGVLSDRVRLFGYHKRYYIIINSKYKIYI